MKSLSYLVLTALLSCVNSQGNDNLDSSIITQKNSEKKAVGLEKTIEKLDKLPELDKRYNFNLEDLKKYKIWTNETIEHSRKDKTYAVIVDKANYSLDLYKNGELVKTYPIELGFNPYDDKMMRGDYSTPEGKYKVKRILDKGQSSFYKAFLIDYPNKKNWRMFNKRKRKGLVPKKASIGGSIEIHGSGSGEGKEGSNWTLGCMALSDKDIDEFFPYIQAGNWITIVKYGTRIDYSKKDN
jgi:murein L,D-transpeptidase YafK